MLKFIELSTLKLLYDDSDKTNKRPPSEGSQLRSRAVHFQSALKASKMAQRASVSDHISSAPGAHMVGGDDRLRYVVLLLPRLHCAMHTCTHALSR